ncbi:nucleoside-diphosphate kinase [Kiritimatiella glycovorans]|uniref:Nucleoside diphosphate kinase n=1 Tax=Kiritimatiella glycovorans TaxID=1307763 RepID=A0A0G3EIY6_9BACT|nr:nucleoside-diphosphate kinase [Kiritimatiella glycovorans]AKJ65377.1 Nucleoside diphosphate kinase [Kiritimatiella glycovorans]
MADELAFALINPYTLRKSRTGGVIARLITLTGLELVAARIFCPSQELAERYAALLRENEDVDPASRPILADYVEHAYTPDPRTGRGHRVMMLLFRGEDAIGKIRRATGGLRQDTGSAETVRATYGDYVVDDSGELIYLEPAVMIETSRESVARTLGLWAEYSARDGGLQERAGDVDAGDEVQTTLVLIKPDNFRFPSSRPGNIIDLFSRSGLRIVGAQVHRMTVSEALEFYGPVREVLREKLRSKAAELASSAVEHELGFTIPDEVRGRLADELGPLYADDQFYRIIRFMTGMWVPDVPEKDRSLPGRERCLAIVYKGRHAIDRIRSILGPTDPDKAEPGSVRREFGRDIMVNAAHASDSPDNAARELNIIRVEKDTIRSWYEAYYETPKKEG